MVEINPTFLGFGIAVILFVVWFLMRRGRKGTKQVTAGKSFENIRHWSDGRVLEDLNAEDLAGDHRIRGLYLMVSEHFKNFEKLKKELTAEGFKRYEAEYRDLRMNSSKKPTVENYKKMVSLLEYEYSRKA